VIDKLFRLAPATTLIVIFGCQYTTICNDITKVAPTPIELVGTYHLNKLVGIQKGNRGPERVPETITLNSDSTFKISFSQESGSWHGVGENGNSTDTAGKFEISAVDACGATGWGLALSIPLTEDRHVDILCFDQGAKHRLAIEFGDSDEGQYAVYASK